MFRIREDPLSGSLVQCLAKNYKNNIIVSVDMDKVGVMAAYAAITPTLLVSKYILCISWIIKCLIIIDARCKHEHPHNISGVKITNLLIMCA